MAWVERSGGQTWRVRYRRDDGTIGALPGFPSRRAAQDQVDDMVSEQRKGLWLDPARGEVTVDEFVPDWFDALDVDVRTEENYRGIIRNHISPRWGQTSLVDIKNLKVHAWAKDLRASGLAPVTVSGFVKLLSQILSDATDERLIAVNPIRPQRRGKRRHTGRPREKTWAEPVEALHVADQINACYGPGGAILEITAAWTGARWGELTGLQRPNLHLSDDDDAGFIIIDPDTGCLHESAGGKLWLGQPKTDASARRIDLAPFTVRLLRHHLTTHNHPHVFVTPDHQLHRRSNFARRAQRPAADGNLAIPEPTIRLQPAKLGLTFHGLRHGHKTWMIEDGIPEIAQALRLGHVLEDKVRETYSHVANGVKTRLLQCLQDRWDKAVADARGDLDGTWRSAA
ncbi:tyrosine-type recombinase/integrase [Actinokineospora terrae]|uniref:Site-specific recombinase XerD n=1 Tax=Actinokineospora terrae TaxID=155974 RepID=A0A1H9WR62_9PSEU|nr:tyrosine-type recombinase/integrase [Actinokineospora terrae]SES36420.1 Site-specific recombinase XerD [Actinokineospora terrae]